MSLFLYKEYIFGGKLFLFEDFGSDSVRVSLPTYIYFFDWFRSGMPLWSDKMGIGTSVLSHGDIVFDPFTYLLFIFGKNNIIYMFVYMVIAKIILAGIFFWMFIGKYSKYKMSSYAKLIGAITYAFGGYMIVVGQNYVFGTIYVYMPLIFLGFEMWLQNKKKWLLILTLTATALYFYYFFYMTAIFFVVYAIFRYLTFYKFSIKHFLKYIFSLAGYSLVALGLSAFFWLPSLALTLTNLRIGSFVPKLENMFVPDLKIALTALGRFFGYDVFGYSKLYLGYNGDYFQLALFCGVITLVLITQIFCEENKKKKILYGIFSSVLLAFLFIPFFSYVFNGFSDFTYRWTYVLHFSLALLLAIAINTVFEKMKVNYKILFTTAGISLISSFVVIFFLSIMGTNGFFSLSHIRLDTQQFRDVFIKKMSLFYIDYFFIAAYTLLTILFFRIRYKNTVKIIILLLIFIELVWAPQDFINNRLYTTPDPVKNNLGYFDNTIHALNYLKEDDKSIYRIDKSYDSVISEYGHTPSNNDSLVQGYRGLKSYNANNQPNYIRFLINADVFVRYPFAVIPKGTTPQNVKYMDYHYVNGVGDRFLLQSFLGVKYYLSSAPLISPEYYQLIGKIKDVYIYRNNNYLPLGFTFDNFITHEEFMKLDNSVKDLALLSFVVIDNQNDLFGIINKNSTVILNNIKSEADVSNIINERRSNSLQITSYKEDNIIGKISVSKNKVLVITIPYDEGWIIYLDGNKETPLKVDSGLMGIKLKPGQHIIELKYFPVKMKLGIIISIITLLIFVFFNKKHIHKARVTINKQLKLFYKQTRRTYDTSMSYFSKTLSSTSKKLITNPKKSIFYTSIMSGISVFILGGLVTRGHSFYNFFNPDRTNYFMDFYNVLYSLYHGPYTYNSIYPPLPLLAYKAMLRLIPYDIVEHGAIAIRSSQVGQIVFLFYMLITLSAFVALIMEIKKGSKIEKYIFFFIILFSAPFLFQFERANIIFVALLFLMIFAFFKDSKNAIIREIALFSLAVSVGIKLYPAFFALLLIKEKRFKDLLRVVWYCAAVFILPFFGVGGISQMLVLFKNIFSTSNIAMDWGIGYAVNILNITRTFFATFGDFGNNPIIIGKNISLIILSLGVFSAFFLRSKWKTMALLTLLMILIPTISYEYTLIFMIIPLILFLDNEEKCKKRDYIYLACFILILTPIALNRIDVINNGFGRHLILPLTYGVLIQNIATSIMALCLITEGMLEQKAKRVLSPIGLFLLIFITKIYGTKFTGMKKYIVITGKVLLSVFIILIIFGEAMFSDIYNQVKSTRPIYTILKPVEAPEDTTGPIISKIEPQYLHFIDKVVVTGTGFSWGRNKRAKLMSSYGEIAPQYWSDNKFIFIVPITWKLGNVKIWAEKPMGQNGLYLSGNKVEIKIIDRLGDFNDDDIKYFAQIKYLDKEARDINDFKNYKLREYKYSRWIPTKVFQLYADFREIINLF